MSSKILTGIIALTLPVYAAAQIKTTASETQLLDQLAQDIRATGEVTGLVKEVGSKRGYIPHTIEKKFHVGNDVLSVVVYDHNQNERFDAGDQITIDDINNVPSFRKTQTGYEVEPSFNDQFNLEIAKGKGQVVSTDPNFNEQAYRKEAGRQAMITTERLYKAKLHALEQAYVRR